METFTKKVVSMQIVLLFLSVFVILCLSFATVWAEEHSAAAKKNPATQFEYADDEPVYAMFSDPDNS